MIRAPDMAYERSHHREEIGRWEEELSMAPDERVIKRFYDRFQKEHASFLTFIEGISVQTDREWYASLMLNRLMFVYFIQKKGLLATSGRGQLDGDHDYLSHKLNAMQARYGSDQFYSFYRYFLLRLFHEGLSSRECSPELDQLLGNVPYLNGGLFDVHVLERDNPNIQIADDAFARIFAFFDEYQWHLDDRPLRNDREINPDVLGYIFEKYINQKQMGAYYTKEDITEYIGKNTIIPYLLEATEQKCLIAFAPDGPLWALLRDDPDRYIYEAVKKGCDLPLPPEIAVGIDDVSRRTEWNKAAPSEYALPTEIWREVVARRARYEEVRAKLANGEITAINDLITYNLDMRQFAEDAITYSEGVDLLNAFYESLEHVTILDPTCGSGAFLFAALTILEPLYEACLDRMQEMVAERDRLDTAFCMAGASPHGDRKGYMAGASPATTIHARDAQPLYSTRSDCGQHAGGMLAMHPCGRHGACPRHDPCGRHVRFRDILAQVAKHPNRRYFMLKSIIINNLYGVDIMEEATEICKLRLFLKLVAQIERFEDIEPLPDIDFNIRAGNTLVGFATYAEAERAITSKLDFDNAMEHIERKTQEVERSFDHFRAMQTAMNIEPALMAEVKEQVRSQLKELSAELDGYLASEYGIDRNSIPKKEEYEERFTQWRQSHQPFHWFVEFYGIMKNGGFDVIIGNPPYVEYSTVKGEYTLPPETYKTETCGNLYSFCMERFAALSNSTAASGLIVPLSIICTDRMAAVRRILYGAYSHLWFNNYDTIPGTLFSGIVQRNSIVLASRSTGKQEQTSKVYTTKNQKWYVSERPSLFEGVSYLHNCPQSGGDLIPKVSTDTELKIISKINEQRYSISSYTQRHANNTLLYKRRWSYFLLFAADIQGIMLPDGSTRQQQDVKTLALQPHLDRYVFIALLSSNLFYFHYSVFSDFRHVNIADFDRFMFDYISLTVGVAHTLSTLAKTLMQSYTDNLEWRACDYVGSIGKCQVPFYRQGASKPIIDEIDRVLARHYGFTDEELDFIINYDIKYRMGRGDNEEGDE